MNRNLLNIRPQLHSNIQNIDLNNIIAPTVPIAIYLQESENLVVWASDDVNELKKVGITSAHINDLKERIDACRSLQTEWLKLKKIKPSTQKNWEKVQRSAISIRKELLLKYKYAFRNNEHALHEIKKLSRKNTAAQLVATLASLYRIGSKYHDLLENISFDFSQLKTIEKLADEVRETSSEYRVSFPEKDKIKTLRDKSYTYLKHLADEIKNAGKFVFAKNNERLKGYEIAYFKKKKAHFKENMVVL